MSKKRSKKTETKKQKKRNIVIFTMIVLFMGGFTIDHFNQTYIYSNTIANNIFIEGIDVSELTKEKAVQLLSEKNTPKDITLKYEGNTYKVPPNEIDLKYNIQESVNEAYNYTKTESYFDNVKRYFDLKENKHELELTPSYDETKLSEAIQKISDSIKVETANAKVWISDTGSISFSPSTTGKELDIVKTKEAIYDTIKSKKYEEIQLKVNLKEPKVSTENAKSVNTLLGEYKTTFSTKDPNRVENIRLSSKRTSNILLMPGEEFSYNDLILATTKSNGYKNAPVILNGVLVEGLGGGVCQVSSTLFNAVLYSGLDITSRSNHSLKSSYVPVGRDAMVNDSGTNFRFKNPYSNPIYVKTTVGNGVLISKIYGSSSDKKNISIKVDEFTQNGLEAAKTYIQYKDDNGNLLSTKYVAKSVYKKPKK
ncbi:VanW family protein [Romboutsia sp.]|uniref:VanW family protein n=1 Tax=Romboutsia sp. TaxID=1965302 RepID=UPI003F3295C8